MIINKTKREMKKLLLTLLLVNSAFAHGPQGHEGDGVDANHNHNPEHMTNYVGDFTDKDKDGMTDVAEIRYGFDPKDSASVPNQFTSTYFIDELGISKSDVVDDVNIGSDNDKIYFEFSRFSDDVELKTRNFMYKLFPILYDRLGNPSRNIVCRLHNRGGNGGSWMANSSGTRIYTTNRYSPRLLVHELVHVWTGKYRLASSPNWSYEKNLSGYEEIAEGLAYEIIRDYINAYPNDENSITFVKGGAWNEWSGRFSNYDLIKHQRWTGGGDFWIGPLTTNDRYNISAVLVQIFLAYDADFFKKVMQKFYEKINNDSDFFPTSTNIKELWAEVVPSINGIPTKKYLDAMPILNGRPLDTELYAVALPNAKLSSYSQKLFCVFPDAKKGEFWWSSSIWDSNIREFGIPEWFGKFKGGDNYYYTDNRNLPYVVNINDANGNHVTEIVGSLGNPTRSNDGGPSTIATDIPQGLYGTNHEFGLYKMTLEFPTYKDFTKFYKEDSYFFGYKNFVRNKSERTILVGIESDVETDSVELILNGNSYVGNTTRGAVLFNIPTFNDIGVATIKVNSDEAGISNTYERAIIIGGTADDYRHQPILILDKDFDGNEDLYSIYRENEVVVEDDTTPVIDNNETEVIVVDNNTTIVDDNTSIVVVDNNTTIVDDNTSIVVVDNNTTIVDDNNVVVNDDTNTSFELNTNVAWNSDKSFVLISWNEHPTSSLFLDLKNGTKSVFWGGHYSDRAELILEDHNLTGNEILEGRFLRYEGQAFVEYIGEFVLNLSDVVPTATMNVVVETNNTTIIVQDVVSIEVDDSNTTIINTDDTVVLIENTESIVEGNSTDNNETNVIVISDDNMTINTETDTFEENASNSVVVVTDSNVTITEDTSKNVEFGDDSIAPPPVVKSAWDSAISIGNNWFYIEWFGYFFKVAGNDWIFHEDLGWMYADWTSSFDNVWLFHDKLGWLWTSSQYFPYLYIPNETKWVYLVKGGYFDFNENSWVKLD
jgi:hypothetical protein